MPEGPALSAFFMHSLISHGVSIPPKERGGMEELSNELCLTLDSYGYAVIP